MAENLGKWPSKRGPISKISPSDGCGTDAVLLAVERWYDFPEFGSYLGNVGDNLVALRELSGAWIVQVHERKPPKTIVLDMDSSESPTYGEQEGSA